MPSKRINKPTYLSTNSVSNDQNTVYYGKPNSNKIYHRINSTNNQRSAYTSLREGELDYNFQGEDYLGEYLEMPLSPPRIIQENGSFLVGSKLDLNCTSTVLSFPPIYLQWLVNNREAEQGVESISYSTGNGQLNDFTGLIYDKFAVFNNRLNPVPTRLGLKLYMDKELFQTNDGYLRLRCVATHAKLISRKRRELLLFAKLRQPSQFFAFSNGSRKDEMRAIWLFVINLFELLIINCWLIGLKSI